jgi:putative sigma-54 modulation protein
MPRMKVNMQSVNFTVDRKLVDFIQRKMDKLETYYDKIIDVDVYLKVENTSEKENKIADVRVNIPGDDLMVKKQCRSFEEAIDEAANTLQRALLKRKEKVRTH